VVPLLVGQLVEQVGEASSLGADDLPDMVAVGPAEAGAGFWVM
jgi:hypothetical protein